MKNMKKLFAVFVFAAFIAAPAVTLAAPQTTSALSAADCEKDILGIHPWFHGLAYPDASGACVIAGPGQTLPGTANANALTVEGFVWRIALNVIGIGLGVVGYIAFFFILYGGFQFLTGGSNASQIEKARKTILNSVVGLVIALSAVAVVNLAFGILG